MTSKRNLGPILAIAGYHRRDDLWRIPAWIAGLIALATPWTVVVGSLAYNEMPMLALSAAAALRAIDQRGSPIARGAWCGWLVGVACGVKPTAILFAAPMVGILALITTPP